MREEENAFHATAARHTCTARTGLCAAAADFYRDLLGFRVAHQDQGFAKVVRDDVQIILWQADDQA